MKSISFLLGLFSLVTTDIIAQDNSNKALYNLLDSSYYFQPTKMRNCKLKGGVTYYSDTSKIINYEYDANKNISSYIVQKLVDSRWINLDKYTWHFNENNLLESSYSLSFKNNKWEEDGKGEFKYNSSKKISEEKYYSLINNVYNNLSTKIYKYNSANKILTETFKRWNGAQFENSGLVVYTYDKNNNNLSYQQKYWEDGKWVDNISAKYTYDSLTNNLTGVYYDGNVYTIFTYYANNLLATKLNYSIFNNKSILTTRESYIYFPNDKLKKEIYETVDSMHFTITKKTNYKYDDNWNVIEGVNESWNYIDSTWNNVNKINFQYNENNDKTDEQTYTWSNNSWVLDYHYKWFYKTLNVDFDFGNTNIDIFPNPSKNQINILINKFISNSVFSIVNISGEVLYENDNFYGNLTSINIEQFPEGIYFVQINDGQNLWKGKFIKQ
ncbi:MAG: hypothetical protein RI955_1876 [Bacteroidota bacterium]|jgi:hypothetical protein